MDYMTICLESKRLFASYVCVVLHTQIPCNFFMFVHFFLTQLIILSLGMMIPVIIIIIIIAVVVSFHYLRGSYFVHQLFFAWSILVLQYGRKIAVVDLMTPKSFQTSKHPSEFFVLFCSIPFGNNNNKNSWIKYGQ